MREEARYGRMIDLTEPTLVEIQIRSDGQVLWVNVDGECRLRVTGAKIISVVDPRQEVPTIE
jgi:hypothetical protein